MSRKVFVICLQFQRDQLWQFNWLCVCISLPLCDTLYIITAYRVKTKHSESQRDLCLPPAGDPVDTSLCSSAPPPEPVACEVPCSRDCVLSDWTPWSICSQTCSSKNVEGKQMRTRSILAYNAGEGEMTCVSACNLHSACYFLLLHCSFYLLSLFGAKELPILIPPHIFKCLCVSYLFSFSFFFLWSHLTVTAMVVAWITVMEGNTSGSVLQKPLALFLRLAISFPASTAADEGDQHSSSESQKSSS